MYSSTRRRLQFPPPSKLLQRGEGPLRDELEQLVDESEDSTPGTTTSSGPQQTNQAPDTYRPGEDTGLPQEVQPLAGRATAGVRKTPKGLAGERIIVPSQSPPRRLCSPWESQWGT